MHISYVPKLSPVNILKYGFSEFEISLKHEYILAFKEYLF